MAAISAQVVDARSAGITRLALAHGVDRGAGLDSQPWRRPSADRAVNAAVGKLAGDGGDDGEFLVGHVEHVAVAAHLLLHGSQGVFAAALLVFVEHDQVGESSISIFSSWVCARRTRRS